MSATVLGVALRVPEPAAGELRAWRVRVGDAGAHTIPPHVTLLPPTRVGDADMPTVRRHLADVAGMARPFQMHLHGTGTFRPVSQVVFVAVAAGVSYCEAVEAELRSGPLGRPLEFPYHPHVTVAHDVPPDMLDLAYDGLADYDTRFAVDGLTAYEKRPDGHWIPLGEFPFEAR